MNEAALVEIIRRRFKGLVAPAALSLEDDAALVPPPRRGHERVVTVDQMHEGVHFVLETGAESAGWRAIVRNLSDLAAMGARPAGFVWSFALTPPWLDDDAALFDAFLRGAARACRRYELPMLGGDLSRSRGAFSCVATLFGDARGNVLRRSGAKPGDGVYVSRALGASAAGLSLVESGDLHPRARRPRQALRAHLWPEPELHIGSLLVGRATSCMDVSDGLASDAPRLASASKVAFHLELAALRAAVHAAAGDREGEGLERALGGGEDYALLFTSPRGMRAPRGCLRIGFVQRGSGVFLLDDTGRHELSRTGFDHFARGS